MTGWLLIILLWTTDTPEHPGVVAHPMPTRMECHTQRMVIVRTPEVRAAYCAQVVAR